ncbi:hypothetical protein EJ04DRAFT_425495 [Polyplosphaeria fusca]|uniref:F-box domain-containing protein n=1 Tax=Polyplosphaeria fusca TaxID=682080 RepID=A0A9P4R8P5_9PLEO|nr:hypothetical protein EJ04DRAFT_425495 [Polyplosphaeria fusca]
MTVTLDRLPFDVLFNIASYINLEDTLNLSHSCQQLKLLLGEGTLCRKLIEAGSIQPLAHHPYSKEARQAQNQEITYTRAVQSIYERRHAFSNAFPFSARIIGQGTTFVYRQGVLCLLLGNIVRISDLHASTDYVDIDLHSLIHLTSSESSAEAAEGVKVSLLYYYDGVLSVHYEKKRRPNDSRILALRTTPHISDEERLVREISLEASSKLFVRHTERYLYCGTYTAMGDHGHHEWEIRGFSLDPQYPLPCVRPVQLEEFFGTDIGSTVTFDIHEGFFYAISNQTSFDVEELDWTSFYHCVRFPLDNPVYDAVQVDTRVYRRQHAEGPIHDSWTDLTLQVDESTNKSLIVESRREWQNGSSRQLRTFYISNLEAFIPSETDSSSDIDLTTAESSSAPPPLPPNNMYTHLVDNTNNPHYAPLQPRCRYNFHEEFGPGCRTTRSFAFTKTKFRAYNYSCSSFLDLVEDDRCCNDLMGGRCLRIRVGARRVAPRDWTPPDNITSSKDKSANPFIVEDDPVFYRHSNIKIWPPPASNCPCSKRLHKILNPPLSSGSEHNRSITGVVDERSLVYLVKPLISYTSDDSDPIGTLVVVHFNQEDPSTPTSGSSNGRATCHDDSNPSHWRWESGTCHKGECH